MRRDREIPGFFVHRGNGGFPQKREKILGLKVIHRESTHSAQEMWRMMDRIGVGGGGCPPSCQPIPGHCRGRQSGHFLEIALLHLPLAALRRFPRRPEPGLHRTFGRAHGPCPTLYFVGRHPCVPPHTRFLRRTLPPAAPFLSAAKEREERTPPKPMVLESLRGRSAGSVGTFQPRE